MTDDNDVKADRAEAEALGISYEALRKRKQRAAKKACPKSGTITKKNTPSGATLGTPKPAARPLGYQAGMRLGPPPVASACPPFGITPMHAFRDHVAAFPSRRTTTRAHTDETASLQRLHADRAARVDLHP